MRPAVVVCPGPAWRPRVGGTCASCGKPLKGRLKWFCRAPAWCRFVYLANHDWGLARTIALRRSDWSCIRDGTHKGRLEVNHIEPRNGRGYELGCHHHQDGLEVLCQQHHLDVTRQQRGWKPKVEASAPPGIDLRQIPLPISME